MRMLRLQRIVLAADHILLDFPTRSCGCNCRVSLKGKEREGMREREGNGELKERDAVKKGTTPH